MVNPVTEPDPFDLALVSLLMGLSGTWQNPDLDKFTHTQIKALNRLTKAGLVEDRLDITSTMRGFLQRVRMQCVVSGQYDQLVMKRIFDLVPEWFTADGKTRNVWNVSSEFIAARLTVDGERAQQDFKSGNSGIVLLFLRGQGKVKEQYAAGYCKVDSVTIETQMDAPLGDTSTANQAVAHASASIGDIVVNNQLNIAPSIVVKIDPTILSPSMPAPTVTDVPVNGTSNADSTPPADKTGQSEGNGRKPKPKSRHKRTDPKADKMLSEAWDTGQYKTHADLAIAKGTTTREVKLAIDRYRKRQAAKGLPRKKPRQ